MPEIKNMYESLRLSAGGGLNTSLEKVAQATSTATIAIGIGGTGLSALRMFKKTVHERVKQDNYDKRDVEKPQYNRIKFLEIDSDDTDIANPLPQLDLSEEFFPIGVSDIIAELGDKVALNSRKDLEWFNKEIKMTDASKGAGGIRQVGKYLLAKKASELYNKFKDMIMTAVTGLGADFDLNVYIMAGIGGGTGSGCYVDVCYLMQQALSDLGYAGSANVLGFFFLPDVNLANPQFPKGGPHEIMVKKNGYAALKELDYLMDIPGNGDTYRQKYSEYGLEVVQNVAPVKLCHLLSTTSINGAVIDDGYNYIMNVVAEYALNFVVKAENADKDAKNTGITLKGIIPNITGLLDNITKKYGVHYIYNILGTSCATVPYKKIGTYLAIKFFDSIKYISDVRANKSDVENLCRSIGLQFQSLDMAIKSGAPAFNLDASKFDTKALKSAGIGEISKPLAEYCEKWKNAYSNKRTTNIATLGRALDSFTVTDAPESVIGKLFKELVAFANNPDFGPYYAAYMMQNSQNHTIASELAGIRDEAKKKRDYAVGQNQYRWDALNNAHAAFRSASFDLGDKKKKAYVSMVEQLYRNEVEIETYNEFLALIDKIQKQLDALENDYFKKYTGIVDKLIATFKDNADYFNTHGMGDEMYTWSIVDINSIKGQLDEVIQRAIKKNDQDMYVAPYYVEQFNKMMLSNQDKWLDESEVKITELISEFIRTEFNEAMSKSMKQYLQEKYNRQGADLIDCIAAEVIKKGLVDNGVPVFHIDPAFGINDTSNHAEYIVLSIPNNEDDFSVAAQKCKSTYNLQMSIAKTVLTDRIYMLEFFSGIPMYAYKDLIDYEKVYYNNMAPGMHMFESESKDWRKLPSPIPATYISSYYDRPDQDGLDAILKIFDDAKSAGIIVEDAINKVAKVRTSGPVDLSAVLKDGWNENKVTINAAIAALEELKASFASGLTDFGTLRANQEFESNIRDDFARKPVMVKAAAAELEKYNSISEAIATAQAAKEEVGAATEVSANFIRALLHSVIFKARSAYKCSYEKRGEAEEIILTEGNEMYEGIPVYRAFVGYKGLDAEVITQLNDKAKKAANNVTDEMYEAVVAFQDFYKGVYKDYKDEATSGKFENQDEIVKFLDELYDSIDRFIINNK